MLHFEDSTLNPYSIRDQQNLVLWHRCVQMLSTPMCFSSAQCTSSIAFTAGALPCQAAYLRSLLF